MASELYNVGDIVWAKMKGFPPWPGKVVVPPKDVKKPAGKKNMTCVFFFSTENYAWIVDDLVSMYEKGKAANKKSGRGGSFRDACESAEELLTNKPKPPVKTADLPSIDEELNLIRPENATGKKFVPPAKDYSRTPFAGKQVSALDSPKSEEKPEKPEKPEKLEKPVKVVEKPEKAAIISNAKPALSATPTMKKKVEKVEQRSAGMERAKRDSSRRVQGRRASSSSDEGPLLKKVKKELKASKPNLPASDKEVEMTRIVDRLSESVAPETPPPSTGLPAYALSDEPLPGAMRFGFLGLGIMGANMVQNLLRSGHKVVVWNRTPSKCQPAVDAGAVEKETPAEVVACCDITFACVSDSQAIREAISAKGGRFLEAVVTGSKTHAEQKQLIFIAAGDRTLFADCEFCFRAMGKRSIYLGDVGNATRMNVVINMIMGTMIAGLAEGMALAEKCGVNQHDVLEILEMGSMNCSIIRQKGKSIVEGADQEDAFQPHFPLKHQQKDLRLAIAMGDQVDQPLPVTASSNELFKRARSLGYGDQDMAAVYKATFL
ncbi:PREDICTED: putative oxidoreductase GLYR1 homolog [Priapulus caudatus]|uniref:Cytokine-like nuclear factor N-PAC n=1 Tax=Priapulus caudatus TaxID=37621 RepID=A0ABM1FC31_PRICU|nr:PREDICTED: putative oxidoreductase GLYR1 homolog [Priapulus caudatus]